MSTPYDLDTPEPEQRPGGSQPSGGVSTSPSSTGADQGQPGTRASDILRDHPMYAQQRGASRSNNINGGERGATKFDEVARGIFCIAILGVVLCLGYILYGIWGPTLSDPYFTHNLTHADRLRFLGNLDSAIYGLKITLFIALVALLFLFYHEETAGYLLIAVALLFYLGMPFATVNILHLNRESLSTLTEHVLAGFRSLAWLPGIPGALLIAYDLIRRVSGGLEEAQIRRTTLKYGQNASRQAKHKNIFLGPCWNTAYCRDSIRSKCPIFVQKKGPCWKHKRGCMCEESIILQAQSGDWKTRVAGAVGQIEGQAKGLGGGLLGANAPKGPVLNMEQKKERCRQCVIYNKHQEQKYKLLVASSFVFVIAAVALLQQNLISLVNFVTAAANSVIGRFSYDTAATVGGQPAVAISSSDAGGPLAWVILGVITLIILSKMLQLVEYCCFKIKI